MPGQYPTSGGPRPRLCDEGKQATARRYLCERCRVEVLICSCCDRGNIYCEQGCAEESRRIKRSATARRYQSTRRGRRKHADRNRRYRARRRQQQIVTHQGSPPPAPDVVMPESPAPTPTPRSSPQRPLWHCHWCGRPCVPFVRLDFLRRGRGSAP